MPEPNNILASPVVRFPNFVDLGDLHSLSVVIQDLSLIYEVTTAAVLPGYEHVLMPSTRLGPRRRTLLNSADLLPVKTVSLSSPLEVVFAVSGALGASGLGLKRLAVSAKAWIDVLSAGLDFQERKQALDRNRALAPLQLELEIARLRNELAQERLRRVVAPPEDALVDQARRGSLEYRPINGGGPPPRLNDEVEGEFPPKLGGVGRHRKPVGLTDNTELAELLEDPMDRVLGYSGGELEVAGDEEALE
jgi:hypothetical protein